MRNVFISYSRSDTYELEALVNYLKTSDVSYWYDQQIPGAVDWAETIDREIKESYALILILTPNSLKSAYVNYEWSFALGCGIPVIPLVFKGFESDKVHPRLAKIQYLDCKPYINNRLINVLEECFWESSTSMYLYTLLSNALRFPYVFTFITDQLITSIREEEFNQFNITIKNLLEVRNSELRTIIREKLPDYWLTYSNSLTSRHKELFSLIERSLLAYYKALPKPFREVNTEYINQYQQTAKQAFENMRQAAHKVFSREFIDLQLNEYQLDYVKEFETDIKRGFSVSYEARKSVIDANPDFPGEISYKGEDDIFPYVNFNLFNESDLLDKRFSVLKNTLDALKFLYLD